MLDFASLSPTNKITHQSKTIKLFFETACSNWKRACKNLGIERVTWYPGTRHSAMSAISKELFSEEIKQGGSQHAPKAMEDICCNVKKLRLYRLKKGKREKAGFVQG